MSNYKILQGDCLDEMEWMANKSIQCCVTSPPYFGLRDYGHAGQIGLETTVAEYVIKMVDVFREVRRVLKPDGTLWLNLGDSYSSGGNGVGTGKQLTNVGSHLPPKRTEGYKQKQLLGIPWRVAFALQEDGWYLRQDIIWHKPNPMPESVRDRCTRAHEHIFLFSKSPKYYFDSEAIKEPAVGANLHDVTGRTKQRGLRDTFKRVDSKRAQVIPGQSAGTHRPDRDDNQYDLFTRNRRSVWTVPTRPYKGAHFAVYPPKLIEPCILAGSRRGDVVFDPFAGSGTTGEVALSHGRRVILCELNGEYIPLIKARLERGSAADNL